jgi:hypothetical protein
MKAFAGGLLLWVAYLVPLIGQERDRSLERITVALEQPQFLLRGIDTAPTHEPRTFGIFTVLRPELLGEFVRVSVPVGELVSRALRDISEAKQRHQQDAARRRVAADLKWFAVQYPSAEP